MLVEHVASRYRRIMAEAARRSSKRDLASYTRGSWGILNPGEPLLWNWHLDAISDHVMGVHSGELQTLLINVPPGSTKTTVVSHTYGPWAWGEGHPEWRFIFGGYDLALVNKDQQNRRKLVDSEFYNAVFEPEWTLERGRKTVEMIGNTCNGTFQSTSVNSGIFGHHADVIIVDDPLDPKDIYGPCLIDHVDWFFKTLMTRFRNQKKRRLIVVMQRLHRRDLSGELLDRGLVDAHLCLPEEYNPKKQLGFSPLGFRDPRTRDGELLFPQRRGPDELKQARKELTTAQYDAQYRQDPELSDGCEFPPSWWKRWTVLPEGIDRWVGAWDFAVEGGEKNDHNVGQVWAFKGTDAYLVDQVRGQWEFSEALKQFRDFGAKWPQVRPWRVEAKANGPAIISMARANVAGILAWRSQASKVSRIISCAPLVQAGNVHIPDQAPWVKDFTNEAKEYRGTKNEPDDQLDAMATALDYMRPQLLDQGAAMGPAPNHKGVGRHNRPGTTARLLRR